MVTLDVLEAVNANLRATIKRETGQIRFLLRQILSRKILD